jgi:hypothetical protein
MVIAEMIPALHQYHLDDAPDLRSCTLIVRQSGPHGIPNERLTIDRLENFYGRTNPLRVQYVHEVPDVWRRQANKHTYTLEQLPGGEE